MARIIGAVTCSHTPTIGFAFDKNKQDDPVWAPIFTAFEAFQQTRNAPGALYSVAGRDARSQAWDSAPAADKR